MSSSSLSTTPTRSRPAGWPTALRTSTSAVSTAGTRKSASKTLGIASFYLRAVCQNRNLWGVEGFEEITIRHSKYAADRFAYEAAPALEKFAESSPQPFVKGIISARAHLVAGTDEERTSFLRSKGFSKPETARIIEAVTRQEGHPPESVFDFVQGITAIARDREHQDARLELEQRAKRLLDSAW